MEEFCTKSRNRVDPCFIEFAKDLRGGGAEKESVLLKWGV